MMKLLFELSLVAAASLLAPPNPAPAPSRPPAARAESVTTSLTPGDCKRGAGPGIEGDPDSIRETCPGTAEHGLVVINEDQKMSVSIVTPDGKEHSLRYWSVITHRFSSLGEKAEWRIETREGKPVPTALTVQVNAYEDEHNPYKETPYFAVAKITAQEICVTDRIPPGPKAAAAARKAAEGAAAKACLKPLP